VPSEDRERDRIGSSLLGRRRPGAVVEGRVVVGTWARLYACFAAGVGSAAGPAASVWLTDALRQSRLSRGHYAPNSIHS
jgi:hypothetical protein